MAKETAPAPPENAPKSRIKLLLIIAVAVLLLLAVGGGLAFVLLSGKHNSHDDDDEEVATQQEASPKQKKPDAPAVFSALDPFTVNLQSTPDQGDSYMQVAITLELEDMSVDTRIKTQMPRIRNDVIMLLSSKTRQEVLTTAGQEKLAEEIRDKINNILVPPIKGRKQETLVLSVLFTNFIIQ